MSDIDFISFPSQTKSMDNQKENEFPDSQIDNNNPHEDNINSNNKKMRFFLLIVVGIIAILTISIIAIYISKFRNTHTMSVHRSQSITSETHKELTARVNRLQKGIDISLWFRFPLDETDDYYNNYITDDDLNLIQQSGFTHVRLSIAPKYILDASSPTKINAHILPFVDKAISKMLQHHLAVVVDIHDEQKTFENSASADTFIAFWPNFAKHLTQFDKSNVYFELLNEPIFDGKEDTWLQLQEKLITKIREQAPDNTIIATGANWGGIEGLQNIKPSEDRNIIYSFHYYEPSAFTHQGADWAGNDYPSIANLAYPYTVNNCKDVLSNVKTDGARDVVQEYCDKKWNKESITHFIQQAVDWSKSNNVPVWVGEFGVYCKQTPRQSKLQWIKDVKDIFQQNHIGWTLWAYDDCFGLGAKKTNGKIIYDKEVLESLGIQSETNVTDTPGDASWKALIGATWQWQLSEPIDQSINAAIYDIDYEKNDARVVNSLHTKSRKVICYVSLGSWENWRGDASQFPLTVIGKDYTNWPGEKWLDIRQINVIGPILGKRLDTCKQKGFDGVEPDNIHGYQEDTGFPLTYNDQIVFNTWIAQEAHKRGLLVGLKNDNEQVKDLLPFFDFAITEDCFHQGWCKDMLPFIVSGKPVFAAEYTDTGMTTDKFCLEAKQMKFNAILKNRGLDSSIKSCN